MKKYIIVLDDRMANGYRLMMQVYAENLQSALNIIGECDFAAPVLGIFTPEGKADAFAMARGDG